MNDQNNTHNEENFARLLQNAYGAEARPSTHIYQQTYQRLLAEMRAGTEPASFPDTVVVCIGGLLFLSVIWLLIQSESLAANPAAVLLLAGALANLVLVPVASIIIVKKRAGATANR